MTCSLWSSVFDSFDWEFRKHSENRKQEAVFTCKSKISEYAWFSEPISIKPHGLSQELYHSPPMPLAWNRIKNASRESINSWGLYHAHLPRFLGKGVIKFGVEIIAFARLSKLDKSPEEKSSVVRNMLDHLETYYRIVRNYQAIALKRCVLQLVGNNFWEFLGQRIDWTSWILSSSQNRSSQWQAKPPLPPFSTTTSRRISRNKRLGSNVSFKAQSLMNWVVTGPTCQMRFPVV